MFWFRRLLFTAFCKFNLWTNFPADATSVIEPSRATKEKTFRQRCRWQFVRLENSFTFFSIIIKEGKINYLHFFKHFDWILEREQRHFCWRDGKQVMNDTFYDNFLVFWHDTKSVEFSHHEVKEAEWEKQIDNINCNHKCKEKVFLLSSQLPSLDVCLPLIRLLIYFERKIFYCCPGIKFSELLKSRAAWLMFRN